MESAWNGNSRAAIEVLIPYKRINFLLHHPRWIPDETRQGDKIKCYYKRDSKAMNKSGMEFNQICPQASIKGLI